LAAQLKQQSLANVFPTRPLGNLSTAQQLGNSRLFTVILKNSMDTAATVRRLPMFPILIGLACAAISIGYRALGTVPWGPSIPHDKNISIAVDGIAFNSTDSLGYAAWAKQSADGALLLSDLFTVDPHRPLYFNPYFYLVGKLSAAFNVSPIAVMNASSPLLAVPIILLSYGIAFNLGYSRRAARLTCLFMAFAGGWSWVLICTRHFGLAMTMLGRHRLGTDIEFADSFPSMAMVVYPYHAAGILLLCGVVYLWTLAEKMDQQGGKLSKWILPVTAAACSFLVAVRPYEFFLPAFSYGILLTLTIFLAAAGRPSHGNFRISVLVASLVGALPLIFYSAYVATQPVWREFASHSMPVHTTALQSTIGFGITLPLAVVGVHLVFRDIKTGRFELMLGFWLLLIIGLIYLYNRGGAKLTHGGFLAISLLAARALDTAWAEISAVQSVWLRRVVTVPLVALALTAIPTLPIGLAYFNSDSELRAEHQFDPEIVTLWKQASISLNRNHAVLCDPYTGDRLPALLGCRVWAGNWSLTPEFKEKCDRLQRAGIIDAEHEDSADQTANAKEFASLWTSAGCDYLLLKKDAPAYAAAQAATDLAVAAEGKRWVIFQRREPRSAR
jgi:hypothetical protein